MICEGALGPTIRSESLMEAWTVSQRRLKRLGGFELIGRFDETVGAVGVGQAGLTRGHPIRSFIDFLGDPTLICRFTVVVNEPATLTNSNEAGQIGSHRVLSVGVSIRNRRTWRYSDFP